MSRHDGTPGLGGAVAAIGLNTFREAIRDRVLYLLLAFALVIILAARVLSLLTVGSEAKIIKDLGLSAIALFGVLTAVFVGVSLVFKEIERRTIYTLLAHPVPRWQFLAGKYLGVGGVLTIEVAVMSGTLALVLGWKGEAFGPLLPAVALIWVELLLVAAVALLFSTCTNPLLATLGSLAVYVAGHLVWSLELLQSRLVSGWQRAVCQALYWVLPNLELLDLKPEAVHGLPVSASEVGLAAAYGLAYAAALLLLAVVVFERREFAD